MTLIDLFIKTFLQQKTTPKEELSEEEALNIKFKVSVVEFAENIESSAGEVLTAMLRSKPFLEVDYYNEPFSKSFLDLDGRTFFDLIDKGMSILDKTKVDVLVWGYRDGDKIRLNFQTAHQYEKDNTSLVSLLDSLYLPAKMFDNVAEFSNSVLNLIVGAIVSCLHVENKKTEVQQKYLLKKIVKSLSADNSAKNMPIEVLPYVMNFLSVIYLTYCQKSENEKDFKIVNNLLETAIKHQDLISNKIHLGCIYNHFGQMNVKAIKALNKNLGRYYKGAISNFQLAQKYLGKYVFPYDYGFISFELADLLYDYWRQKDELQALRDSVFNLREAEKIFTYALFPEFWADIEGELGHRLSVLSSITKNNAIAELAIQAFKNQQKIVTENRDPFAWAEIQEKIGNVYYRLGKETESKSFLEESLEYFHDALYIFENMEVDAHAKRLTTSIAKVSDLLG